MVCKTYLSRYDLMTLQDILKTIDDQVLGLIFSRDETSAQYQYRSAFPKKTCGVPLGTCALNRTTSMAPNHFETQ